MVIVNGTLRFFRAGPPESSDSSVARVPDHFYFEVGFLGRPCSGPLLLRGRIPRSPVFRTTSTSRPGALRLSLIGNRKRR
jgi:hypothetical protein